MAEFIESIPNTRDKAIALLLAKTGIRRGELIQTDIDDVNIKNLSILLKETKKRSNRLVFFDDECARLLARWLDVRAGIHPKTKALFINNRGKRLEREGIYEAITKWAKLFGLHNPKSPKLEERFSPHCFRHWFTTQLIRAGMRREYIKELRGDARKDAIDIYNHIDKEELKKAYLAHIPKLGIT
ncbi:MAG: tyrosine-type recombinase/integrase [Candidatus Thermoplasmatota archaeon]|nr:tyrosine-type recombinase/integrase [Candidatus Thermoplasmatota archaeon]